MAVWMVGDPGAPARGTLDPEILTWCEMNEFSLVKNNRSSMSVHLKAHLEAGQHVPGIFILDASMSLGQTIDELLLIWGAASPQEYADLVNFLPVS